MVERGYSYPTYAKYSEWKADLEENVYEVGIKYQGSRPSKFFANVQLI
jgi:hypothetical protein